MELKGNKFAVVGASNNPKKFGHKVMASLLKISPKVFPINLKENEILGQKVFKSVKEIKSKLDVVVFVVPPQVSLSVLKEIKGRKVHFWFQQGSFDENVIDFCKNNGLKFTSDKCIIEESEKLSVKRKK